VPQLLKPLHEVFNDGFLIYGHDTTKREKGKRVGEVFNPEGKLAFKLLSAREQDYDLAGSKGSTLDLKVKTLYPPSFRNVKKTNLKCLIDSVKYEVIHVDWDNDKRYLYFYLQEVGDSVE